MQSEPASPNALAALIRRRRTNLRVDSHKPVSSQLVEHLCQLATWAPNHKLTEPWRFAVLVGEARRRLGDITAEFLAGEGADPNRVEKTRTKYLRAPVVVVVGSHADPDPIRHGENRDAVAAGVQNMLLGATAAGLNSFWATGAAARNPETNHLCGFEAGTAVVALVYLGWPIGAVPTPERSVPKLSWVPGSGD